MYLTALKSNAVFRKALNILVLILNITWSHPIMFEKERRHCFSCGIFKSTHISTHFVFPLTFHMFWIAFYGAFQLRPTLYLDSTWSAFYRQWFPPVWFCRQCPEQSNSLTLSSPNLSHSSFWLRCFCRSIITAIGTGRNWFERVFLGTEAKTK